MTGFFCRGELCRLEGEATFEPMERVMRLKKVGDGRGHFRVEAVVEEPIFDAAWLEFVLWLDQTGLPVIAKGLRGMDPG